MDSQRFEAKIIHKDQEAVNAFCLNTISETTIAAATHKELIELDISTLLSPPVWVEDDSDNDSDDGYVLL